MGTWTVKARVVRDGVGGEVSEAMYEVRRRGDGDGGATLGGALGAALLLVMGLFGFVVFAGVCTAGYNALFKTTPTMRGPGVSDPRLPRTNSAGSMELGRVGASGSITGFRNNPTSGALESGDESETVRMLRASSSGDLTPARMGKRD